MECTHRHWVTAQRQAACVWPVNSSMPSKGHTNISVLLQTVRDGFFAVEGIFATIEHRTKL